MPTALKLRAVDDEDLAVLSAILQDALVVVGDMGYLPDEQRFVLVANRFRWEPNGSGKNRAPERVFAGLCIDRVATVQRRQIDPRDSERILLLLALRTAGTALFLDFAGGATIRLDVAGTLCHLEDLGDPWPTRWRPRHPIDDPS